MMMVTHPPKGTQLQPSDMSNSSISLLFPLSETHVPSRGGGGSTRKRERTWRGEKAREGKKKKAGRQQVYSRAESRQSISSKRLDANPLSSAFSSSFLFHVVCLQFQAFPFSTPSSSLLSPPGQLHPSDSDGLLEREKGNQGFSK